MTVRPARAADIPALLPIFLTAFKSELTPLYGNRLSAYPMQDVFQFCLAVEPKGFWVAQEDDTFLGYVTVTQSLSAMQRRAFKDGYLWRWLGHFLQGKYKISLLALFKISLNKLFFLSSAGKFRFRGDAQVLNLAVSEQARGKGVGVGLLTQALSYLRGTGVREVRLEVRPENKSAKSLYEKMGFYPAGRTRDLKGEWLVMTRSFDRIDDTREFLT